MQLLSIYRRILLLCFLLPIPPALRAQQIDAEFFSSTDKLAIPALYFNGSLQQVELNMVDKAALTLKVNTASIAPATASPVGGGDRPANGIFYPDTGLLFLHKLKVGNQTYSVVLNVIDWKSLIFKVDGSSLRPYASQPTFVGNGRNAGGGIVHSLQGLALPMTNSFVTVKLDSSTAPARKIEYKYGNLSVTTLDNTNKKLAVSINLYPTTPAGPTTCDVNISLLVTLNDNNEATTTFSPGEVQDGNRAWTMQCDTPVTGADGNWRLAVVGTPTALMKLTAKVAPTGKLPSGLSSGTTQVQLSGAGVIQALEYQGTSLLNATRSRGAVNAGMAFATSFDLDIRQDGSVYHNGKQVVPPATSGGSGSGSGSTSGGTAPNIVGTWVSRDFEVCMTFSGSGSTGSSSFKYTSGTPSTAGNWRFLNTSLPAQLLTGSTDPQITLLTFTGTGEKPFLGWDFKKETCPW